MKYLLIAVIVLLVVWLWRSGRGGKGDDAPAKAPAPEQQPHEMVCCAHCGVHLPRSDAVQGRRDLYCSLEHQQSAEP